jgi:hypothetical protein
MSNIKVVITGGTYAGTITENSFQLTGKIVIGKWVYSNGFSYVEGENNILLVFNSNNSVSVATSPTPFLSNPSVTLVSGAKWSGTLPSESIDSARQQITAGYQELYRVRGTNYDSFYSSYQETMFAGILVAMLGTTVLFYTFRQL